MKTTSRFRARLKRNGVKKESPFATEVYDAVWSIALGLARVNQKYKYQLHKFDYGEEGFSSLLRDQISQLNFTGISVSNALKF